MQKNTQPIRALTFAVAKEDPTMLRFPKGSKQVIILYRLDPRHRRAGWRMGNEPAAVAAGDYSAGWTNSHCKQLRAAHGQESDKSLLGRDPLRFRRLYRVRRWRNFSHRMATLITQGMDWWRLSSRERLLAMLDTFRKKQISAIVLTEVHHELDILDGSAT